MKGFIVFVGFCLSIWSTVYAQGQIHRWDWFQEADSSNYQVVHDIVIDSANNAVYVVGGFESHLSQNFGGESATGGKDGFVTRFDLLGNLIWSFDIAGNGSEDEEVLSIDVDRLNGDIYVGGYVGNDGVSFIGVSGNSIAGSASQIWGGTDAFIACYRSDGRLKWAHRDGGVGDDVCNDVHVEQNANGSVAYTGSFTGLMELNSSTMTFGPSPIDNKVHMFVATREKGNGDGIWRGYSDPTGSQGGEFQRGVALTRDNDYLYLLGEYDGTLTDGHRIIVQRKNGVGIYVHHRSSSDITEPNTSSGQSLFFAKLKNSDGDISSWHYSIYGDGEDYAGDIAYRNNKLYIAGSITNNAVYNGGSNNSGIVLGNEAFVSIHSTNNGATLSKFKEPNIVSNTTFSMFNSISFNRDYLILGGKTNETIRFDDNNSNNDVVSSNGRDEGFVAFYTQDTNFVEKQEVEGSGTNEVNAVKGWRNHVFVGGAFGHSANLDDDFLMVGQDNESGFVSLLKHRDCTPRIEYNVTSICQESDTIVPDFIEDPVGAFSQVGSGLDIDPLTGVIDPFNSTGDMTHQIVYTTFLGCADTFDLYIIQGSLPAFDNPPINDTANTDSQGCGKQYSYSISSASSDCGQDTIYQIDMTGYSSDSIFPVGTTMQSWVVSDGFNPNDTVTFSVTIVDNIAPTIQFDRDTLYVYSNSNSCGAVVDVLPYLTYSDNCGVLDLSQVGNTSNQNGAYFNVSPNPKELTYQVLDNDSLSASDNIIVLVQDTIKPVIENCISGDTTLYLSANECEKEVLLNHITASDACGIQTSWSFSGTLFPLDTTSVTFTAEDVSGNSATCTFDVIVVDSIIPQLLCPPDTSVFYLSGNNCGVEVVIPTPVASDNCLDTVTQVWGIASGTVSTITMLDSLEFRAVDFAGNEDFCKVYYSVVDTVSPTFDSCYSDTIITADIASCTQEFNYTGLTAEDNCTLNPVITQIDATNLTSGSYFPLGITNQMYQVVDSSGNINTCSFNVEVVLNDLTAFDSGNTPNGLCLGQDTLIELVDLINTDGYTGGQFYVNGNATANYSPSDIGTEDSIVYVYGGGACVDSIVHVINLHSLIANAGLEDSVCGREYDLSASPEVNATDTYWTQGGEMYTPNNMMNNATVTVSQEGDYVFVWNVKKDECLEKDTVVVHFFDTPTADAGINQTVEENQADLNASWDYGYGTWRVDVSDGVLEDSSLYNTSVSNLNLGLNTFVWVVTNGVCPSDSSTVRVFYDMLTIPNAFSPNGDGVNDEFRIKGFELYSDARITILDRWGEQIYFNDQPNEAWDGTYEGKNMVEDTYFYILFINEKEYTGYIELRR